MYRETRYILIIDDAQAEFSDAVAPSACARAREFVDKQLRDTQFFVIANDPRAPQNVLRGVYQKRRARFSSLLGILQDPASETRLGMSMESVLARVDGAIFLSSGLASPEACRFIEMCLDDRLPVHVFAEGFPDSKIRSCVDLARNHRDLHNLFPCLSRRA